MVLKQRGKVIFQWDYITVILNSFKVCIAIDSSSGLIIGHLVSASECITFVVGHRPILITLTKIGQNIDKLQTKFNAMLIILHVHSTLTV